MTPHPFPHFRKGEGKWMVRRFRKLLNRRELTMDLIQQLEAEEIKRILGSIIVSAKRRQGL